MKKRTLQLACIITLWSMTACTATMRSDRGNPFFVPATVSSPQPPWYVSVLKGIQQAEKIRKRARRRQEVGALTATPHRSEVAVFAVRRWRARVAEESESRGS